MHGVHDAKLILVRHQPWPRIKARMESAIVEFRTREGSRHAEGLALATRLEAFLNADKTARGAPRVDSLSNHASPPGGGAAMYDHVPRLVRFEDVCAALAEGQDPLSVLPVEVATVLRGAPAPRVLTDFAGRDSVAAAMAWMEAHQVGTLIPVGDVVPTRYGEWSVYEDNWRAMRDQVASRFPQAVVSPWFVLEDVDAWRFLNGRYLNELVRSFGFFTPCLGCHLHFYSMRAVLAKALAAEALISGEKELHGRNKRKANQTAEAVAAYRRFSEDHGVAHHFPIHQVTSETEMGRLLGDGWREGERQLHCVMSGNDQGFDGNPVMSPSQIAAYMNDFALPLAARIVALRQQKLGGAELQREIDAEARHLLVRRTS